MKIKHQKEPKATIKVIKGDAFSIENAPHLPKLHQAQIIVARRGQFKTTAVSNQLRMYKETGTMDKIIIVSSTFKSNRAILEQLDIAPDEIFGLTAFGLAKLNQVSVVKKAEKKVSTEVLKTWRKFKSWF